MRTWPSTRLSSRQRPRTKSGGEFTPFLRFDTEIRRIVCTTNAIESDNARIRRAVKARGHFPNEQAMLKCVYMAIMSLDPTGKGQARWTMRWKTALNAFDVAVTCTRQRLDMGGLSWIDHHPDGNPTPR